MDLSPFSHQETATPPAIQALTFVPEVLKLLPTRRRISRAAMTQGFCSLASIIQIPQLPQAEYEFLTRYIEAFEQSIHIQIRDFHAGAHGHDRHEKFLGKLDLHFRRPGLLARDRLRQPPCNGIAHMGDAVLFPDEDRLILREVRTGTLPKRRIITDRHAKFFGKKSRIHRQGKIPALFEDTSGGLPYRAGLLHLTCLLRFPLLPVASRSFKCESGLGKGLPGFLQPAKDERASKMYQGNEQTGQETEDIEGKFKPEQANEQEGIAVVPMDVILHLPIPARTGFAASSLFSPALLEYVYCAFCYRLHLEASSEQHLTTQL